jgi:hypothetical protein
MSRWLEQAIAIVGACTSLCGLAGAAYSLRRMPGTEAGVRLSVASLNLSVLGLVMDAIVVACVLWWG